MNRFVTAIVLSIAMTGLGWGMPPVFAETLAHDHEESEREHRGERQHGERGEGPHKRLLVTVTTDDNMTQGMAMVLANQAMNKDAEVRVLLCSDGGRLALEESVGEAMAPRDVRPQQLLQNLVQEGAKVEVCAIFLPNTDYEEEDLMEGVGVAQPDDVADYMLSPHVHFFTF